MRPSYMKNCLSSPWPALILITLLAAIVYSNIYQSPFVFDDVKQIEEKVEIRDLSNYFSLKQLLKPRAIVTLVRPEVRACPPSVWRGQKSGDGISLLG